MVRAILDGKKTQTRRIFKQAVGSSLSVDYEYPWATLSWLYGDGPGHEVYERTLKMQCPQGDIGEHLWVRETFCPVFNAQYAEGEIDWIDYRATPRYSAEHPAGWHLEPEDPEALKWRPSIHMPRWASRITLEVVNIRVERLQDIKEEDAKAEGVDRVVCPCCQDNPDYSTTVYDPETLGAIDEEPCRVCDSKRKKFLGIWESFYGEYTQYTIPWVWVIEFKRV
ncbi:hypothetical protein [Xenorhabdus bovienii]|uniref:hypothetical protein n=1 Tax=Xenorhabdus bovienii TaxID=40576 RepID=UPI00387E7135